ncbi:hypothetical protein KIF24_16705 [Micromonospora sp. Llam7]|uniref:hypothetical protein n=1 Tax=Micromonospora tarapacensis TaxID=2835305 RepID=UPI001C83BEDB|nr:hypothetical protein [Micromonospora tarapacensis]MBX7267506.1 hypothetical protein [Micromonospora tarapacensis]
MPSLLSQQITQMPPDRIGEALIALTGRDELLDNELKVRRKHANQLAVLDGRVDDDKRDRLTEDAQLAELGRRELARSALAKADQCWEAYLAQGFIERTQLHREKMAELAEVRDELRKAVDAHEAKKAEHKGHAANTDLTRDADDAEKERDKIGRQRGATREAIGKHTATIEGLGVEALRLRGLAEGDDGKPVDEHLTHVQNAEDDLVAAKAEFGLAEKRLQLANEELENVKEGREGLAGRVLAALDGVADAVSLLDAVAVTEPNRATWEPRLWLHRDAVVVAPGDEQSALRALQSVPGATLVLADGPLDELAAGVLPDGLTSSVPLSRFLNALKDRLDFRGDPSHVRDSGLSEAVLGGFASPFAGREARLNLARAEVTTATSFLRDKDQELRRAVLKLKHERQLLEAAEATARLIGVRAGIKAAEANLGIERDREAAAEAKWKEADAVYTSAKSALDNHEERLRRLADELKACQDRRGELAREERAANVAVDRVQISVWRDTWHQPYETATALVEREETRRGRHPAAWWLGQASLSFKEALTYTTNDPNLPDSREESAPPTAPQIDSFDFDLPDSAMYATYTRSLRDLLDATNEKDRILQDRIQRSREKRQQEIAETEAELEQISGDLKKQQEMVESSIDTALRNISARLDELDMERGYGARLDVAISRPPGPEDSWGWHVTPKWKRSSSGGYISYREVANSAQVKIFAIQLVLAALLVDDSVPARLLILDELGNSLGDANRKDVLSALHNVAKRQGVTILGTCQDSVIYDAAGVCGEILWFSHTTASEPYNRPTRAWGFDSDHKRVDLLAPWLREGREEP